MELSAISSLLFLGKQTQTWRFFSVLPATWCHNLLLNLTLDDVYRSFDCEPCTESAEPRLHNGLVFHSLNKRVAKWTRRRSDSRCQATHLTQGLDSIVPPVNRHLRRALKTQLFLFAGGRGFFNNLYKWKKNSHYFITRRMSSSVKFKWGKEKVGLSLYEAAFIYFLFKKKFCIVYSVCAPLKVMRSWVLDLDNWQPVLHQTWVPGFILNNDLDFNEHFLRPSALCANQRWYYILCEVGWMAHGCKQVFQKRFKINTCISQHWTECPRPSTAPNPLSLRYPTPNDPRWPQPAPCPGLVPFFSPFTIRPFASCWRK